MTMRGRFTDEFKARVALEALVGDKKVQEIAARHQAHHRLLPEPSPAPSLADPVPPARPSPPTASP